MTKYRFEIGSQDWFKRRQPTPTSKVIKEVRLPNFQKIDNSYCTMIVEYEDGEILELEARIVMNDGHGRFPPKWSAQGLNPHGISILVRLIED
ncbi:hypothetical protein [Neptuniibacter sp. QD37_11]|uniref:hypothetical protein n=1 Tax=Neptuniibacter sp. QD37_11 TaxID=3398209 RepID=UPI0039F52AED